MNRRSRIPSLLAVFFVFFAASGAAGYAFRTNQLRDRDRFATNAVTIAETTVIPSTLLSVDSSVTDTTAPETTVAATTPATTEPPPVTDPPVKRPQPQISNDGALLRPSSDRRLYSADTGCDSLAKSGNADSCDRLQIGGVEVAWVLDSNGSVDILQRDPAVDGPDVWNVALHSDSKPTREPRVADVTGDGQPEIVVGWRDAQRTLAVDVVEVRDGNPGVSLHLARTDGRISAGDGQIDVWNGVLVAGAASATPSSYDHWIYSRTGGRWSVQVERDDNPPAGQL